MILWTEYRKIPFSKIWHFYESSSLWPTGDYERSEALHLKEGEVLCIQCAMKVRAEH